MTHTTNDMDEPIETKMQAAVLQLQQQNVPLDSVAATELVERAMTNIKQRNIVIPTTVRA